MQDFVLDQNVLSFDYIPPFDAYDRVEIIVSEDASYYYPQTGDFNSTLTLRCIWGTQEMAEDIYNRINGYVYYPYNASGAELDPAAQLGDSVSVNGVDSELYVINTQYSSLCSAEISAPADQEIDHEYPYVQKNEREVNRKFANTAASLIVLSDEITSKIDGEEATSLIDQKVDSIKVELDDKINNNTTEINILQGEVSSKITSEEATSLIDQSVNGVKVELNNKIDGNTSSINVLADSVSSKITGSQASSLFEQKLGEITLSASSSGGSVSISLKGDDGVVIDSATTQVRGKLTAATISANNITAGTINADSVTVSGHLSAATISASNLTTSGQTIGSSGQRLAGLYANSAYMNTVNGTTYNVDTGGAINFSVGGTSIGGNSVTHNGVTKSWADILNGGGAAVWG